MKPKAKRLARVLDRVVATRRAKVDQKDRIQSLDRRFRRPNRRPSATKSVHLNGLSPPRYRAALQRNLRPGRSLQAHADAAFRAEVDAQITLRKNYDAHGAFAAADRPHVLDLLGFSCQAVFTTFCQVNFGLDRGRDMVPCCAAAGAHKRMVTDVCAVDARLPATVDAQPKDCERSRACALASMRSGAKALRVPPRCAQWHIPGWAAGSPRSG